MPLIDSPLHDALAAFSSSDPTPGGGSASALASALGASLLIMVASLPKTRTGATDDRAALDAATPAVADLRDRLMRAIDADAAAYDGVVAAYKQPKGSADEQQARREAIQRALRAATDVPLDVMQWSAQALVQATTIAKHGHAGAASDVGVAVALLRAGLHGARLNADINLGSVKDEAYTAAARETIQRTVENGRDAAEAAERSLQTGR